MKLIHWLIWNEYKEKNSYTFILLGFIKCFVIFCLWTGKAVFEIYRNWIHQLPCFKITIVWIRLSKYFAHFWSLLLLHNAKNKCVKSLSLTFLWNEIYSRLLMHHSVAKFRIFKGNKLRSFFCRVRNEFTVIISNWKYFEILL